MYNLTCYWKCIIVKVRVSASLYVYDMYYLTLASCIIDVHTYVY